MCCSSFGRRRGIGRKRAGYPPARSARCARCGCVFSVGRHPCADCAQDPPACDVHQEGKRGCSALTCTERALIATAARARTAHAATAAYTHLPFAILSLPGRFCNESREREGERGGTSEIQVATAVQRSADGRLARVGKSIRNNVFFAHGHLHPQLQPQTTGSGNHQERVLHFRPSSKSRR